MLELEEQMLEMDEQITSCPISALLEAIVSHWEWALSIVMVEHIVSTSDSKWCSLLDQWARDQWDQWGTSREDKYQWG